MFARYLSLKYKPVVLETRFQVQALQIYLQVKKPQREFATYFFWKLGFNFFLQSPQ